jgi:hypothetical protein
MNITPGNEPTVLTRAEAQHGHAALFRGTFRIFAYLAFFRTSISRAARLNSAWALSKP